MSAHRRISLPPPTDGVLDVIDDHGELVAQLVIDQQPPVQLGPDETRVLLESLGDRGVEVDETGGAEV